MKKVFLQFSSALVLAVLGVITPQACHAVATDNPKDTKANLRAAYQGEVNAHARYLAFAVKADSEGLRGVGSLFRAAATGEEIHAKRHAKELKRLGEVAQATAEVPVVSSTKENLAAAISGENYEQDTMYPQFIAVAKAEGTNGAVKAFNLAKSAVRERRKLFKDALDHLEDWRVARSFWVCQGCGYTVNAKPLKKCPSCYESPSDFNEIV